MTLEHLITRVKVISAEDADPQVPGIYEWQIPEVGCYVGQYSTRSRPLKQYLRNVQRLLTGRPYRPKKPNGFRLIHRELAFALLSGTIVNLFYLENHREKHVRNRRERELFDLRRSKHLAGGPKVLNQCQETRRDRVVSGRLAADEGSRENAASSILLAVSDGHSHADGGGVENPYSSFSW